MLINPAGVSSIGAAHYMYQGASMNLKASWKISFTILLLSALTACETNECAALSQDDAKSVVRDSEAANNRAIDIRSVELRPAEKAQDIAAIVKFDGPTGRRPAAVIYGDCVIEWTSEGNDAL